MRNTCRDPVYVFDLTKNYDFSDKEIDLLYPTTLTRIAVSENRRYLVETETGRPFFYLADTAWELFHRLDRSEMLRYFADRASKRFTVIQAVALAELDGLRVPNRFGQVPFRDLDPSQPNELYWEHVDWSIAAAGSLGLRIGLLPTWGDKWNIGRGSGPEIFLTAESARAYGEWIGRRYRDAGVIWILGGDRPVQSDRHRDIIRAMARGIRQGDGGNGLITFHPNGGSGSSDYFPGEEDDWLDFHMWQTGHHRNSENHTLITRDWCRLSPVKPVLDGEPGYEDHPSGFKLEDGYLEAYDCRKAMYWALFAGACGHTYGCHPVWQMCSPEFQPITFCRRDWIEALSLPGSSQMQHARALLESRPYFSRIPDQSLVVSENKTGCYHIRATRDEQGSYAMIYLPHYAPVSIDLSKLSGNMIHVWWFDPRTGVSRLTGKIKNPRAPFTFEVPLGEGPDWVLVLDDAERGFQRPGQIR